MGVGSKEYKHTLVIGGSKNLEFDANAVSWNPVAATIYEAIRRVSNPFDFYPDSETRIKMEYIKILASGTLTALIPTKRKKDVFNLLTMFPLIEASKSKTLLDITLILKSHFGLKAKGASTPVTMGWKKIAHVKLQQAQILSVISQSGAYMVKIDGSTQSRGGSIPW